MTSYLTGRMSWWLGALVVLLAWNPAGRAGDQEELLDAFSRANALEKKAEAEKHYLKALELAPRVFGEEHENTARILINLANLYLNQARYAQAESLYLRGLRIFEKVRGPDHPIVALSLNNLAALYKNQAEYAKAEPLYLRCVSIAEKAHGPDHPEVATSLNNLATLYAAEARYARAEALFRRGLRIFETARGPEHLDVATSLNNLANVCLEQGQYGKAEPLYQRALSIREKVHGPDHPDVAASLATLALLYTAQGQYARAEPFYQRSLRIKEKVFGPDHPDVARRLLDLAELYWNQGEYDKAEPLLLRGLRITEKAHGPDHPHLADILNSLANLYADQGQPARAEPLYQRSLRIREKLHGPDHPNVAASLNNLANLYRDQGQHARAESLYQRSLAIRETVFGPEHPSVAQSLYNLALLAAARKQWDQAADLFDRQRRASRRYTGRELLALPQAEQLAFLQTTDQGRFHNALSLGWLQRGDPALARRSASWLLNGKAVAHQALARRVLLERAATDPALRPVVRDLQELRRRQAALAFAPTPPGQQGQRHRELDDLARQQQRLERQLGQAAGAAATADEPWVELDAVRQALPADAVLLELARFRPRDFASDHFHPARYVAWVIPASGRGDVHLLDLGPAERIDQAIRAARQGLAEAPRAIRAQGEPDAETAVGQPLEALARLVLHPLLPDIGKARRWVVSPDGGLWLVPWAALPLPGGKYAVEEHALSFAVSGRDLVRRPADLAVKPAAPLVLANPDFDLGLDRVTLETRRLLGQGERDTETRGLSEVLKLGDVPHLPGTAAEAEQIAPKLRRYAGQEPVIRTEREALAGVFQAARGPRVVVLSTHGFFLPDQERAPREGERLFEADQRKGMRLENPLLRCGLLLAGCNNAARAKEGEDNGVLTGLQIVGTDLRGCELVVLSACETGLGDVRNGEGVAGLRQAFQLAGAKSVVATLWQVPDQQSAQLMIRFFDNLAAKQNKADALRNAQLTLIKARRDKNAAAHPFFWAAFTLTGQ